MPTVVVVVLAVLGGTLIAGAAFFIGRAIERRLAEAAGRSAEQQAQHYLDEARREAESTRAEAVLAAKEENIQAREHWEKEARGHRKEFARQERRLEQRHSLIDQKLNTLDEGERELESREKALANREKKLTRQQEELSEAITAQRRRLEQISGISVAEARSQLMKGLENEAKAEAAALIRDIKESAKRTADKEARKLIALAAQRMAAEHTAEITVSAVALPSDEMKGRIIGREGRNIRAFETATGVDVIIDDTPDTVIISCFEPVRRECARLALEQLIADGRIHPGRIEEVVEKVRRQVEEQIIEAGEQAVYELGIHGMHQEMVKLVGRMKFRTSYGQNILDHSKEVAFLAGMMAAELKFDERLARRGALLHDIGKVLTHEHEGSHVQLGVEVAEKYGEDPVVINCIAAHHDDVPHETPISVIVQTADAVSGSRPGARREAFDTYIKRLNRLEEIASSFDGVEKTHAIQAGREVRIVVTPDVVDDGRAAELSEKIARKIENELQYPGQIKVVVIRETRSVDVAR